MDQGNLLKNIIEFRNRSRPRTTEGKDKKKIMKMLSKVELFQYY